MWSRHVGDICFEKRPISCLFLVAYIYPNQILICPQIIPNLPTMCKCGLDMSLTCALKNHLFSVFSCLAWIYPNQLLIYSRNIPNLSIMCKCGLDMSVISALKNYLFGAFHVGMDLSKPTINIFAKYS
jgi:hypothetical protein